MVASGVRSFTRACPWSDADHDPDLPHPAIGPLPTRGQAQGVSLPSTSHRTPLIEPPARARRAAGAGRAERGARRCVDRAHPSGAGGRAPVTERQRRDVHLDTSFLIRAPRQLRRLRGRGDRADGRSGPGDGGPDGGASLCGAGGVARGMTGTGRVAHHRIRVVRAATPAELVALVS